MLLSMAAWRCALRCGWTVRRQLNCMNRSDIKRLALPDCLLVTAESEDGEIMGLRHVSLPVEGVQFHPEALLTEHGHKMLENFLKGGIQ